MSHFNTLLKWYTVRSCFAKQQRMFCSSTSHGGAEQDTCVILIREWHHSRSLPNMSGCICLASFVPFLLFLGFKGVSKVMNTLGEERRETRRAPPVRDLDANWPAGNERPVIRKSSQTADYRLSLVKFAAYSGQEPPT